MSKPTSKKPHGNPNLAKVRPKGKGSVKGRTRSGKFPKYLEDFCHHIHAGKNIREAAVMVGRSATSGFYLFNRPDVQARLAELPKEYGIHLVEAKVEVEILCDDFLDEQLLDVVVNGEGKNKRGRLRGLELALRRKRLIDPPNAQTIVALNMTKMVGGNATLNAPKFYEANRFLKLKQGEPAAEGKPNA